MSESILFRLLSGAGSETEQRRKQELRLEQNEQSIAQSIHKMRLEQADLARRVRRYESYMKRAIKRGDHVEAKRYAVLIGNERKQMESLQRAQRPLIEARDATFYARQNIKVNNHVEETIKAIDDVNQTQGVAQASRVLPAAMRVGQTLKQVSEQFREASGELNETLAYSDDEEEDLRADAERTLQDDPTAVHTTTNPELILQYALEHHSLTTGATLSRHNVRAGRDCERRQAQRTQHASARHRVSHSDDEDEIEYSLAGDY